ncbi:tryptophan 2,3-dioxygenase family protein [Chryseolinea sp. H1M3-3]|uniref:tryptophan 2,3-dioxygenase family protein n=1 Tax=Chryseolinea sp. H1M3-3 TaxID=3034144 RepID=UPI0023EC9299|nr:tryptophan 2,3-dioxygenase family protein [Chryseolinea sp. H1M3-3]
MGENVDAHLLEQLKKLQAKYNVMGQDLSSYLDGLLYSDYLTYWDYIRLDTLLSLQSPETSFPDEKVFIMYHQITELYFRMIMLELEQISTRPNIDAKFFIERVNRIIRYFQNLVNSFEIMVVGMEKEQFLKFRMALLPASGFQSAQYRLIEIASTDMINLVSVEEREGLQDRELNTLLEKLYWRSGATELASGKKTLTLQQFEAKYMGTFYDAGMKYKDKNLLQIFEKHLSQSEERDEIIERLRVYDALANIHWRFAHLKSAGHYLQKNQKEIKATGGTNWQKYLPARIQKVMFFPELWSEQEHAEWGKGILSAVH